MQQDQHEKFMKLAIELANGGIGQTLPNPLVGSVIVNNGDVISQGFHAKFGDDHAEIVALNQAGERAKGSTIYVTLEPCSHVGKTPPCVDRIIASGAREVVIGMTDPNPAVNGNGIKALQQAGIAVKSGVCEQQARELNQPFIKYISQNIPYVTLKIAQTLDGKIADSKGNSQWITGKVARQTVQEMRYHAGAVLIGSGTALADNPKLTLRHKNDLKQPVRIVLDSKLQIDTNAHLVADSHVNRTVIFTTVFHSQSEKAKLLMDKGIRINAVSDNQNGMSLNEIWQALREMNIAHVFIEGGHKLSSSLLAENHVDELITFIAPKIFGAGTQAYNFSGFSCATPLQFQKIEIEYFGNDLMIRGRIHSY